MTTAPERSTEGPTVRESVPTARAWLRTYVIGVFMGTADGVPGVSGGTIALIAGIYDRLIAAVTAVTPSRFVAGLRALSPLDGGVSVPRALAVWEEVDGWFLLALLAGVGTAVVVVTGAVEYLSEHAPVVLFGFFFGLIAASAVVLLREISLDRPLTAAVAAAGFVLAFVVSGLGETLSGGGLAVVFVAGAVAVSAMVLPGISGSLLLVVLSQYTRMTNALQGFLEGLAALATGGSAPGFAGHAREVVVFVLGGLVGLFTVARAVRAALDADREATYAFLIALVVGALRAPVATLNGPEYDVAWTTTTVGTFAGGWFIPRFSVSLTAWTTATMGTFAGAAVAGALVVLVLDWYAVDLDLERV
jgi:putative membrane protein